MHQPLLGIFFSSNLPSTLALTFLWSPSLGAQVIMLIAIG
jgi:hypothetical protein